MPNANDRIGGKDQLDIGVVIAAPFKDKQWFTKSLVMGLIMLVPIAGQLNLSGWMRAIADRRMAGGEDADTLPEANFSYIGAGWSLFLAYLPLLGVLFALLIGGGVAAGVAVAAGGGHGGEDLALGIVLLMYAGMFLAMFVVAAIGPAITFLHIAEGEPWASAQLKRIWEVMKSGGAQYLLFFVACLVAGVIAQLGMLACYIGMFVTIPLSQAMQGAAVAEYARLSKPINPTFPVEGGTGGGSGTPFPVKS